MDKNEPKDLAENFRMLVDSYMGPAIAQIRDGGEATDDVARMTTTAEQPVAVHM